MLISLSPEDGLKSLVKKKMFVPICMKDSQRDLT